MLAAVEPLDPSPKTEVCKVDLTKRESLQRIAALLGIAVLTGCGTRSSGESRNQTPTPAPAGSTRTPPTAAARSLASPLPVDDTPVCILTPQATEGPFYFDTNRIRQNIIEDRVGSPLRMSIRVMRVDDGCAPLKDALVDIWHTDAGGLYSGYPGQPGGQDTSGQTFLRGAQVTDADGIALFDTIYPGWYPGRTVHIHFKVRYGDNTYATSQFYFPDDFTDRVYSRTPYSDRPNRTTRNANDSLLRGDPAESNLLASVMEDGDGYFGTITVGVIV